MYGNPEFDWIVLTVAGILNVRNEWPLSSKELYDFTVEKYGLTDINNVKHYETTEVKNSRGVSTSDHYFYLGSIPISFIS